MLSVLTVLGTTSSCTIYRVHLYLGQGHGVKVKVTNAKSQNAGGDSEIEYCFIV